ncbi:MAG: SDR family oxidoreductase [Kineosporiaceae bacterium]
MSGDGRTAVVVGASRGLGRGIAQALAASGRRVVTVSRTAPSDPVAGPGGGAAVTGDASDAELAARVLGEHRPDELVIVAGAVPHVAALQDHTWETFSRHWHADVAIAFAWLRQTLLTPLPDGGRVVVVSSGAALRGSPLSGGYAGAKATQRFLAAYAQEEADRAGLGVRYVTLLPRLTPLTDVGRGAARAYAARTGVSEDAYVASLGALVTPEGAGAAVLDLLRRPEPEPALLLTGAGLAPVP